jgi:hypothetical protein
MHVLAWLSSDGLEPSARAACLKSCILHVLIHNSLSHANQQSNCVVYGWRVRMMSMMPLQERGNTADHQQFLAFLMPLTFAKPKAAFSKVLAYTAVRLSLVAALARGTIRAMTLASLDRFRMDSLIFCRHTRSHGRRESMFSAVWQTILLGCFGT